MTTIPTYDTGTIRQERCTQLRQSNIEEKLSDYPTAPCVYVLRCRSFGRDQTYDIARDEVGEIPSWLDKALDADDRVYVGSTTNITRRMKTHWQNGNVEDYTTWFTSIFPAHSLIEVEYCDTVDEAREREGEKARELRRVNSFFVYQH